MELASGQKASAHRRPIAGFTLVELMTVLAIVVILVTILLPTISKMRRTAWVASTRAEIAAISGAVERYQQNYSVYPGPLTDDQLYKKATPNNNSGVPDALGNLTNVTGSENLLLGLMGGLKLDAGVIKFDRTLVGTGPRTLGGLPKKTEPFIDGVPITERPDTAPTDPNYGDYKDNSGEGTDSRIPEILDKFPNGAMPILYLRAHVGLGGVVSIGGLDNGSQVRDANNNVISTQYDLNSILPYTDPDASGNYIGEGKGLKASEYTTTPSAGSFPHGLRTVDSTKSLNRNGPNGNAGYVYPYDAFPYFVNSAFPPSVAANPNGTGTPKQKNAFILISAGADRVYGTNDDIVNYGNVE